MFGLIGGLILSIAVFWLVFSKFEGGLVMAILASIGVVVLCGFTGLFGCVFVAIAVGALFKIET